MAMVTYYGLMTFDIKEEWFSNTYFTFGGKAIILILL